MKKIKFIGIFIATFMLASTITNQKLNAMGGDMPQQDFTLNGHVFYVGPEMADPQHSYDAIVKRINFNQTLNLLVTIENNQTVVRNNVKKGDPLNPPVTAYWYE